MANYFLDFEFNGDVSGEMEGKLLSVSLLREDGMGLYGVFANAAPVEDDWVKKNVVPHLDARPNLIPDSYKIRNFKDFEAFRSVLQPFLLMDDGRVNIIADWPIDLAILQRLMITGPGTMITTQRSIVFTLYRCEPWETKEIPEGAIQHHAWWDTYMLSMLYKSRATALHQPRYRLL